MLIESIAAAALAAAPTPAARQICRPEDFGGVGDGARDDTRAIQSAIDKCAGRGVAQLTSGSYLSGPIWLKSGSQLEILKAATLTAVTDPTAYTTPEHKMLSLVNAANVQDVALFGDGAIDGQGQVWWPDIKRQIAAGDAPPRPRLIDVQASQRVAIRGLRLRNSVSFHLVLSGSDQLTVQGVDIQAPADSPNTDGIDIWNSRDVAVSDCSISVGDDHIALKASGSPPRDGSAATARVTIQHCQFGAGHGLSIGSDTSGGVADIQAQDLHFVGGRIALRIKSRPGSGGDVRRITFRDVHLSGVEKAIVMTSRYSKATPDASGQGLQIHGVTLTDVEGDASEAIGEILGPAQAPFWSIRLDQVRLRAPKPLRVEGAQLTGNSTTLTSDKGDGVSLGANAVAQLQP
jgi:polygalacturonase